MPTVNWGLNPGTVEDFDRSKVFAPYAGKVPPTGVVYAWELKKLAFVAPDREGKYPQLRAALELYARDDEEEAYAGFFKQTYSPVSPQTAFRYVPLLDALGISEREFLKGTKTKEDGTIISIGRWKMAKGIYLLAQLQSEIDGDGNVRININDGWFGTYEPEDDSSYEDGEDDEDGNWE